MCGINTGEDVGLSTFPASVQAEAAALQTVKHIYLWTFLVWALHWKLYAGCSSCPAQEAFLMLYPKIPVQPLGQSLLQAPLQCLGSWKKVLKWRDDVCSFGSCVKFQWSPGKSCHLFTGICIWDLPFSDQHTQLSHQDCLLGLLSSYLQLSEGPKQVMWHKWLMKVFQVCITSALNI